MKSNQSMGRIEVEDWRWGRRAFTLLELLTVMAIVGVLASILMPSLGRARQTSRRALCQNNLRQIGIGCTAYASDDRGGSFSGALSDSDDNQNWLFPSYVDSVNVFVCPSTQNSVDPHAQVRFEQGPVLLRDLTDNAKDRRSPGSSYEVYGFMHFNGEDSTELSVYGTPVVVPGVRKTEASALSYAHQFDSFGLKGTVPGPSALWLFVDAEDANNNVPWSGANHGATGTNVQFCDGHVQWVKLQEWTYSYELSQDENRTGF